MKRRAFTLIEVVIALTILVSSLAITLTISSTAAGQVVFAHKQWIRTHCLIQAAEYYLSTGPQGGGLDNLVWPYAGDCSMSCQTVYPNNPPDLQYLEENSETLARTLTGVRIEVFFNNDYTKEELVVDKLLYTGNGE